VVKEYSEDELPVIRSLRKKETPTKSDVLMSAALLLELGEKIFEFVKDCNPNIDWDAEINGCECGFIKKGDDTECCYCEYFINGCKEE